MQEVINFFKLRQEIYLFLSKSFYKEPDSKHIDELYKYLPVLAKISKLYNEPLLISGIEDINRFLVEYKNVDEENAINYLADGYASLFLGIASTGGKVITPQESVYLPNLKVSMQENRDEVLAFYAKYKGQIKSDFTEPEDHISAELGFMGYMSGQVTTQLGDNLSDDSYLSAQAEFLDKHLLKWVELLNNDIASGTDSFYYKGIAAITAGFVKADRRFLAEILA